MATKSAAELESEIRQCLDEAGDASADAGEVEARPEPRVRRGGVPKAVIEKAVHAARLYYGSIGKVRLPDEQKLFRRMTDAVERIVKKANGQIEYWNAERQVKAEAIRRGRIMAMPGKDV